MSYRAWVDMTTMRGGFPSTPITVAVVFLTGTAILFRNVIFHHGAHLGAGSAVSIVDKLAYAEDVQLGDLVADATDSACHHFSCFDVYRCGGHPKKMLVRTSPRNIIFRLFFYSVFSLNSLLSCMGFRCTSPIR